MISKEYALRAYSDLIQFRRREVLIKSKENLGKIEIHHIVPVSMGGLDADSNKIALLAEEHFMAHVYLYVIHHDDQFHNQAICALMNMHKGTVNGSRKGLKDFMKMSKEYQQAKEEFAKIASKTFSEANKGEKNSHYGKHWIRNPQTHEFKLINDGELLPKGWEYGKYQTMTKKVKAQLKMFSQSTKGKHQIFNPTTDELRFIDDNDLMPEGFEKRGKPLSERAKQKLKDFHERNARENIIPRRIEELRPMYQFYIKNGWNAFKEHFNYKYTQQNFVILCKKYLPEFISHQGKKYEKLTN